MKRRGRPRTVKQLIIDLTPLLDVIFIMLIVVLARGTRSADEKLAAAGAETQEAGRIQHEAELLMGEAQTITEAYADIDRYFSIISVSAGYDFQNRRNRTVRVKINEAEEQVYNINPSNEDSQWDAFEKYIENRIAADPDLPVVLALNMKSQDRMLYRDEERIRSIFDGLQLKYPEIETRLR